MLTYGIPPEFRGGVHIKPPYAIGSVPSLLGHAVAYRWRSLPRVRRHRASKAQGSSERVLPWQVTMDQLIFASLSHTHYWYEVSMLKVPSEPARSRLLWAILSLFLPVVFWHTRVGNQCAECATSYCLPKPLLVYGSMLLLSTSILSSYSDQRKSL